MGHQIKLHTSGPVSSVEIDGVRVEIEQASPSPIIPAQPISLASLYRPDMVKIAANGERLPETADNHVAVLLPQFNMLIDARNPALAKSWKQAVELGSKCDLFGGEGWELWDDVEASLVIRRDLHEPACDKSFFPNTPTDYVYWTRRPRPSPVSGSAYYVSFSHGYVSWGYTGLYGFVRARRFVSPRQF